MKNTYLFDQEEIITKSKNSTVTLTNYRLRYESANSGKAHIVSIMLEKISSIEIHYKSNIIILVIGILFISTGFIMGTMNQGEPMLAGMSIGAICLFIYYIRRKHVISIASDGGTKIHFFTKGMNRDTLMDFINEIEKAKKNRTADINSNSITS